MRRIVIGDCHGHLEPLIALLAKLGIDGDTIPEDTELFFLGDLIDRGPDSARIVALVRRLCSTGRAHCLLANHEFNFVNFHTETATGSGVHRRPRNPKNTGEVAETLRSYERTHEDPEAAILSDIAWFKRLPIAMQVDELRLVHACWHPQHLETFEKRNNAWYLNDTHWDDAWKKGTPCYESAEVLCKGLEEELPAGISFRDKGGVERTMARVCWWNEKPTSWEEYVRAHGIDYSLFPDDVTLPQSYIAPKQPTLFGHYWFTGKPHLTSKHCACLDFSVAASNGGYLCAYEHHSGETELFSESLHWVRRNPH